MNEVYIAGSWKVCIGERTLPKSRAKRNFLVCANCGQILSIETFRDWIGACETGYLYCSNECAEEDVKEYLSLSADEVKE